MSVRAIKKKENQLRRPFKQQQQQATHFNQQRTSSNQINLQSRSNSFPSLRTSDHHGITLANRTHSKSESELSINKLPVTKRTSANLINAKSEICLKTLSVHDTMEAERLRESENTPNTSNQFRRMSERSNVSSSQSPTSELQNRGFADPNNIRIPIIGYEVMEERARFTVSCC